MKLLTLQRPHRGMKGIQRAAHHGFTIMEVMMATMVLAFAITTSITTLQAGYRSIDLARSTTLASQVLQSMVEDIRLLSWSGTGGPGGINIVTLSNVTNGTLVDLDFDQVNRHQSASMLNSSPISQAMMNRFRFSRTVTDVPGRTDMAGVSNLKRIVIEARWTNLSGQRHSLQYTTYYARDGLYAYYST